MPGYPLTENGITRWDRFVRLVKVRTLMVNLSVGILAGLAITHLRLGLGLPGHKVLLWMTPVILARLLSRHPLGATVGVVSAACVSLGLGGNFAGGVLYLPLVGVAGVTVDAFIAFADRHRLAAWLFIPLVGLSGMSASIICAIKRLLVPVVHSHVVFGLGAPFGRIVSYLLFGLLAGLIAATVSHAVKTFRRKNRA